MRRALPYLAILALACDGAAPEPVPAETAATIAVRLSRADGQVAHDRVAGDLDGLRALRASAALAGPALCNLLPEAAPLYLGRGPNEAARLRGYVLATLADVGPPPDALPAL